MTRGRRRLAIPIALALLVAACDTAPNTPLPSVAVTPPPAPIDWHDATQPVEARVEALLAEMTVDEKIGQMTQLENGSAVPATVTDLFLGSVLSGGGGAPTKDDPAGWYEMVDAFQQAALGTRLGIPMLYGVDAVHGHNNVPGATIFPQQIGLGAAADPDLVERIGRATATEMAATGIRWDFGPVVAVPQDVRWGRTYEGYGEDPIAVSDLGSAFIRGMQGADLTAPDSAIATAKHYVGDGGTTFGSSTHPGYLIDQGVVTDLDEETFRAIHLTPYEAAVDAGVRVVMASFSGTSAGKVHGDHHLITELLKGELGFTGFVVSDWGGIDQVDPDYNAAVAKAITAGIDMAMVPYDGQRFQEAVRHGLSSGDILEGRVDDAVRRILRVKFEMGLFEQPMPPGDHLAEVGSDAHRAIARDAVARSLVLLETEKGLLPLASDGGDVLLAGRGADDIGLQSGGWTISWQGSPGDITPGTTIAEGLADRLGDRMAYDAGGHFPAGSRARTGIVVVAEPPYAEGEGDSATLTLPAADLAVVKRVRPLVDRLIVIVLSGRPVMLDEIPPSADALIAAWLPGTEGAGVADVLLGDVPFRGTTPVTWPLTPDDAPRTGKEPCDGARYALGYGLDASGATLGDVAPCRGR